MSSMAEAVTMSSKSQIQLGKLLIADGLILQQDLDFALEHQKFSRQLLGEILVRIGALKPSDLEKILRVQSGI